MLTQKQHLQKNEKPAFAGKIFNISFWIGRTTHLKRTSLMKNLISLKINYLKNKYVNTIYKICERSIISLFLFQTKDMPDKEKRTTVSITEKEREIIEKLSIEIMGRVNLSATLSYIVRQWTKMRKDND